MTLAGSQRELTFSLIDEYRSVALWFIREDYYPATDEERLHIERDNLDKFAKKLENDRSRLEEEINVLKKKLKTLQ